MMADMKASSIGLGVNLVVPLCFCKPSSQMQSTLMGG